jgi:hypothetical protein
MAMIVVMVLTLFLSVYQPAQAATIPTFTITAVVKDKTVTIKTANFPASRTFEVRMGFYGSYGWGTWVTQFSSGSGGTLTKTFNIPAAYKGQAIIAIRTDSTTGGYYAYNWFYNNNTALSPSMAITSVVPRTSVTIKTANFPAGKTFKVLMKKAGSNGVGGTYITSFSSGSGGTLTKTFTIPTALKYEDKLTIRLESGTTYVYYKDFANYSGIPTFSITAVKKDTTVTVKTSNFPANKTFEVRMGYYGDYGYGTWVTQFNSGTGGALTKTFNIPAAYKGETQISIRMDDITTNVYYAYNWFWNNNAP